LSGGGTASLLGGPFSLEDGSGKRVSDPISQQCMLVYFGTRSARTSVRPR
jgi:hypothetical protein